MCIAVLILFYMWGYNDALQDRNDKNLMELRTASDRNRKFLTELNDQLQDWIKRRERTNKPDGSMSYHDFGNGVKVMVRDSTHESK